MSTTTTRNDAFWIRICIIIGLVICAAVAFLILGPRPEGMAGSLDVSALPTVNASLNGITIVLLVLALVWVKLGKIEAHKATMLTAFGTSSLFLVTYVIYHWFKAGPKPYEGEFRTFYLFVLGSHIILSTGIVPLALVTLYRGWHDQRAEHRKIARITWPIWMYVSITGVTVYAMLYT